ncbi:MAG: glycosyltransferase family 4 protein [Proteobacteria bacterium]|nr:glycosyltransferase family 4 protein [Pseudomonadota bacterium]
MHVLYIHQYFSTRSGAAGTRSYEFARALIARGHTVTMLCGSTQRAVTGLQGPFVRGRRTGNVDGIDVIEFDVGYSNYDSILTRAKKFVSFSWGSSLQAAHDSYDVIFTTSTPLTVVMPGAMAWLIRRKTFVFEVRDLWPELPKALGLRNPFALVAMHALEWFGYKTATRLVALAPGIADGIARLGIPRSRIDLIPNGCDCDVFDEVAPLSAHDIFPDKIHPGDLVAVFAGAHGIANGLDAVIEAASALQRRRRPDIKLLLIGEGGQKPRLVAQALAQGLDNVVFSEPVAKERLIGLLRGADIGLQVLADCPAFYRGTSPNKFFDYLAAGRPVLINYPGWLAELVVAEQCGFAVPPGDPASFADRLIWLADHRDQIAGMGERAKNLGRREFDRPILAERFTKSIELAASANGVKAAAETSPEAFWN